MNSKTLMPAVYRLLVTLSGLTFLISGLLVKAPFMVWGPLGQVVVTMAGIALLITPWRAAMRKNRIAVYTTAVAGSLMFATSVLLDYPAKWSAASLWFTVTVFTVLLVAFGWVSEPPNDIG